MKHSVCRITVISVYDTSIIAASGSNCLQAIAAGVREVAEVRAPTYAGCVVRADHIAGVAAAAQHASVRIVVA